jgi:hypothetical protein
MRKVFLSLLGILLIVPPIVAQCGASGASGRRGPVRQFFAGFLHRPGTGYGPTDAPPAIYGGPGSRQYGSVGACGSADYGAGACGSASYEASYQYQYSAGACGGASYIPQYGGPAYFVQQQPAQVQQPTQQSGGQRLTAEEGKPKPHPVKDVSYADAYNKVMAGETIILCVRVKCPEGEAYVPTFNCNDAPPNLQNGEWLCRKDRSGTPQAFFLGNSAALTAPGQQPQGAATPAGK